MNSGDWQRRGKRQTRRTNCPACRRLVLAHTNGNGDFVFLEPSPPPWEVHACLASIRLVEVKEPPPLPFVGSVVRNGKELIITGVVKLIDERKLFASLKNLAPTTRASVDRVLRERKTEVVLRVSENLDFRICCNLRNVVLGSGQKARATVAQARVPVLGDIFLLRELEILGPL